MRYEFTCPGCLRRVIGIVPDSGDGTGVIVREHFTSRTTPIIRCNSSGKRMRIATLCDAVLVPGGHDETR